MRPSVAGLSRLGSSIFVTSDILFFRAPVGRAGPFPRRDSPERLLRDEPPTKLKSQGREPRDRRARPPGPGTKPPIGCRRTPRRAASPGLPPVPRSADVCSVYATICEKAVRGLGRATVQCCHPSSGHQ